MKILITVLNSLNLYHIGLYSIVTIMIFLLSSCDRSSSSGANPESGIMPYEANLFYWSYKGQPVLLLGGTKEDNIFQIEDLEEHLRLLKSVGGNYIRCTMSSRDPGNLRPYLKNEEGLYDLDQPNPAYWGRLQKLLDLTKSLDIIVQLEIWATYDFYWGELRWSANPFNPKLNANYTAEVSQLPDSINYPAQFKVNPFFTSVPALSDNKLLRPYQEKFVDKLLEVTLPFDNVLYCIDNETNAPYPWGQYWSKYIRTKAQEFNKEINVTEMWDSWDPTNGAVKGAKMQHPDMGGWYEEYTNPELHENSNYAYSLKDTVNYNFLDIANHNAQDGQKHYETGSWIREAVKKSGYIRPVNNVKIYGADISQEWSGSVKEGQHRFWRNIFAGHASARFHRPNAGIGLSDLAQRNIQSMRMLTESVDFFSMQPDNKLLSDREKNEAYCMNNSKGEYILYFPEGGVVDLNIPEGEYSIERLRILKTSWMEPKRVLMPGVVAAPHDEAWAIAIKKIK